MIEWDEGAKPDTWWRWVLLGFQAIWVLALTLTVAVVTAAMGVLSFLWVLSMIF